MFKGGGVDGHNRFGFINRIITNYIFTIVNSIENGSHSYLQITSNFVQDNELCLKSGLR